MLSGLASVAVENDTAQVDHNAAATKKTTATRAPMRFGLAMAVEICYRTECVMVPV